MNEDQLPDHWRYIELDEVAQNIQYGYTESAEKEPVGPKFLRISDIQNGRVDWGSVPFCEIDEEEIGKYQLKSGDLLFARTGGTVGKSYLIQRDVPDKAVFASYLIRVKLGDSIDPRFAYYFFQTNDYWRQISESKAGIGQPNVNASKLSSLTLPLPPLSEQRRIVAKIEELFSNLDAGMDDLQAAGQQLERYRLSVLQAAVEGRLTADWRRTHDPEPADQLLKKNLTARENSDYYRKPKLEDFEDGFPSDIPDTWTWTRVGAVCYVRGGKAFRSKNYQEEGIPLVRISNIQNHEVTFDSDTKRLPEDFADEHERYLMKQGDIVVAMSGSVGKLGVFKGEDDSALLNQRVGRFEFFDKDLISEKYFFYYAASIKNSLFREAYGTSQRNISATAISNFAFPLPPLEEQHQIASEVERLLSVADDAAVTAEREHTRAERLRQSILKKAFSGQLVPHEEGASPPSIDDTASEESDTASSNDVDSDVEDLMGSADPSKQIEMDL